MPIPPLAPNPSNGITVEYVEYVAKIVLPFISIIVGLVVWTWKKMERSIDKVSEALELHVGSDEEIHDHLFTASRKTGEKLAELIGTVTIFGVVVNQQYVFLITCGVVIATGLVVMVNIIRNCDTRNKRIALLSKRRRKDNADTTARS